MTTQTVPQAKHQITQRQIDTVAEYVMQAKAIADLVGAAKLDELGDDTLNVAMWMLTGNLRAITEALAETQQ